MENNIIKDTNTLITQFMEKCPLVSQKTILFGCSTSEVLGKDLGTASNDLIAKNVFESLAKNVLPTKVNIAVQCCEHINRSLVVERFLAEKQNIPIVNVIPQPNAGGAFAAYAYHYFKDPVVVENIKADYGIDIGLVMIGMHLKDVVVPVRLLQRKIGEAIVVCARTRPKFIGGSRSAYNTIIS